MTTDNSGPAFPVQPYSSDQRHYRDGSEGMTLRDYFAGQALAGLCVPDHRNEQLFESPKSIASRVYGIADAMLKARDQ